MTSMRIVVFPAWSDNPYINLLYLAPRAAGHEVVGVKTLEEVVAALDVEPERTVLHTNWTSPICQTVADQDVAAARAERFMRAVDRAKERGARVIWTVHNILPHDLLHEATELRLHAFLADRADAVHILSPSTPQLAAPHYRLPVERTVVVPHSSYQGVYGSTPGRSWARGQFGIRDDELAILFFGQLRPYKGVLELVDAVRQASARSDRRLVLMLAGKTTPEDTATIEAALPLHVRAIRRHSFVPDSETGKWFAAADVGVLPYRLILNSGSMFLAATFGLPIVMPDEPHLVEQFGQERWMRFFDRAAGAASIADRILESAIGDAEAREAALRFARSYTPYDMSSDFLRLIERIAPAARAAA